MKDTMEPTYKCHVNVMTSTIKGRYELAITLRSPTCPVVLIYTTVSVKVTFKWEREKKAYIDTCFDPFETGGFLNKQERFKKNHNKHYMLHIVDTSHGIHL